LLSKFGFSLFGIPLFITLLSLFIYFLLPQFTASFTFAQISSCAPPHTPPPPA
jgi:hypothetical protein